MLFASELTNEDRKLFCEVERNVKTNPEEYRTVGKYLDDTYNNSYNYWQRRIELERDCANKSLQEITITTAEAISPYCTTCFGSLRVIWRIFKLNKNKSIRNNSLFRRLGVEHNWRCRFRRREHAKEIIQELEKRQLRGDFVEIHERFEDAIIPLFLRMFRWPLFLDIRTARAIYLFTWLLTDPDADTANLGITKFEKWSWRERDMALRNFTCFKGMNATAIWTKAVRVAKSKLEAEQETEPYVPGNNVRNDGEIYGHLTSRERILELISQGESHTLEFKETLEYNIHTYDRSPGLIKSSLKTIAAFLNADGGTLLIGISDAGEVKGIAKDLQFVNRNNYDGFEQKIRNLINDHFNPSPLGNVEITFEELPEGPICRINVEKSFEPVAYDKDFYIRHGNVTRKLEGRTLADWLRNRNSS